jgi:hypothetical protein
MGRTAWVGLAGVVASLGLAVGLVPAASAGSSDVPIVAKFDGAGTFSVTNGVNTTQPEHADDALSWSVTYLGTLHSDGSLSFSSAAPSTEGSQTAGSPPGTYHFTDSGSTTADCRGTIPAAPGSPAPAASATGGKLTVQSSVSVDQNNATHQFDSCQGTDALGDPTSDGDNAANTVGVIQPYLPDVLSARIDVPANALGSGTFTKSVTQADAPAQLPTSCSDQFGSDPSQCQMSLQWSGKITITVPCAQVTFSEGDAPPVGSIIAQGQSVRTGPGARLELRFADGSISRLGHNAALTCDRVGDPAAPRPLSVRQVLGIIWAKIAPNGGSTNDCFDYDANGAEIRVQCPDAAPGVRGAADVAAARSIAFTLDAKRGIFHLISGGKVRIRVGRRRPVIVRAGQSAKVTRHGARLTKLWPKADRAVARL